MTNDYTNRTILKRKKLSYQYLEMVNKYINHCKATV